MADQDQTQSTTKSWEESPGVTSSMRVSMLLFNYVMLLMVVILTIHDWKFPAIPDPLAYMWAAVLAGKIGQTAIEKWNGIFGAKQ